jgi:hypothetical protein
MLFNSLRKNFICSAGLQIITSLQIELKGKQKIVQKKKGHIKLYICRDKKSNYYHTNKHSKDHSRLFFTSLCYYYDHELSPFSRSQPIRKLAANVCTACQYEKASAYNADSYGRLDAGSQTLCSLLQIVFHFSSDNTQ